MLCSDLSWSSPLEVSLEFSRNSSEHSLRYIFEIYIKLTLLRILLEVVKIVLFYILLKIYLETSSELSRNYCQNIFRMCIRNGPGTLITICRESCNYHKYSEFLLHLDLSDFNLRSLDLNDTSSDICFCYIVHTLPNK